MHEALLDRLRALCGADGVNCDPAILDAARHDVHASGLSPIAILTPSDADSVAPAIAAITADGCSVAPRGGGLSYTAGYVPADSKTVLIDLSGLNRIVAISPEDMTVTAEAGVTWAQLHAALAPHGLRLPFFGTFSGMGATVGGGLSHGALFFGSARYGSAAEMTLVLDVALADGSVIGTGQSALLVKGKPGFRGFGPDITGLFLNDGGTLGIKIRATFRVIRAPAHLSHASFAFERLDDACRALRGISSEGLVEDCYIMDPGATDHLDLGVGDMVRSATAVARASRGFLDATKSLLGMAAGGRGVIPKGHYSLHMTAGGRHASAVAQDIADARAIARGHGGREVAATIPMVARADPFPNLNGVLGPGGGRWAALNAKVALSEAVRLTFEFDAMIAEYRESMEKANVRVTRLASAFSNHCFSFEAVFHWRDTWLPLHRSAPDAAHIARFNEPAADPVARELVDRLRQETVQLFRRMGAASNQIGRTYPYLSVLSPEARELVLALKRKLDPEMRMNPGVLEFPANDAGWSHQQGECND